MDRKRNILLHSLIWLIFVVVPSLIYLSIPYEIPGSIKVFSIATHFYSALAFYVGYLILSPKLLGYVSSSRKVVWSLMWIIVVVGIKIGVTLLIDLIYAHELKSLAQFRWFILFGDSLNNVLMVGIGVLVKIGVRWFSEQKKKSEIQLQKQTQELAFLKTQINPHFFFNTLNNIYSLVYKKSDDAPDALLKLSDIMRYMLYETKSDLVSLEKELLHLNNYLELERLRFRDPDFIVFSYEGAIDGWQVPPMLLLSFVENAFKHGSRRVEKPAIEIDLTVNEGTLTFRVINFLKEEVSTSNEGIGLKNIKRRLELLYPDCHQLEITQTEDRFKILLQLFCSANQEKQ